LPFSADPGHIFAFSTAPVIGNRIVVHAWGAGSFIEFYANSHKKDLRGVQASNGLLEIAEAWFMSNLALGYKTAFKKRSIASEDHSIVYSYLLDSLPAY
jgi:hypothetical protein